MPETTLRPDQIWLAMLGELQLQLTKSTFDTWLRDTALLSHTPDTNEFVIGVNDAYTKDWLEHRLLSTIQRTLIGICGRSATARLEVLSIEDDSREASAPDEDCDLLAREWRVAGIPEKFIETSLVTLDWSQPALQKPELREYIDRALNYFRAGLAPIQFG